MRFENRTSVSNKKHIQPTGSGAKSRIIVIVYYSAYIYPAEQLACDPFVFCIEI